MAAPEGRLFIARFEISVSTLPFGPAWMRGEPAATALLPCTYADASARAAAARRAGERPIHPAALAALTAQAAAAPSPARTANLARLARPGAVCVVTGQQAGLFGGPAYTLYKAASAIVGARALEAETGQPCVPVFWLQNEDHDFEEIASAHVVDAVGELRAVGVPVDAADADRSVGARRFGDELTAALDALTDALDGLPHAAPTLALLRAAYQPGRSPDGAFVALIDALFAESGLLVLDPRAPGIAAAVAPIHRRAVKEAEAIAAPLLDRVAALGDAGFRVQVHVRPKAPLSFFHPEGRDGPRYRIEPEAGGWRLCGTQRTEPAAAVTEAPDEAFGTSALLRPIVQDHLLPTVAYVGGPGELAYFAQLPDLYTHFGIPMPLFVPRGRALVVDEASDRLLSKLGLATADLHLPEDALLLRVGQGVAVEPSPDALATALLGPMEAALAAFAPPAAALDAGLAKAVARTRASLSGVSNRLVNRYRRTLARKDAVTRDRLDRVRARLAPEGAPQERTLGFASLAAWHGPEALLAAVLAHTVPFDGGLRTVHL